MASTPQRRRRYIPTDADRTAVEILYGTGFTVDQIAKYLNISERTVYNKFKTELANGKVKIDALAVGELMKGIKAGNMTAVIFYLKTRLKWKERSVVESEPLPLPTVGLGEFESVDDAASAAKEYMRLVRGEDD